MISERKIVLFLIPSLAAGGAERVFLNLLRNIDRRSFEIHLGVLSAAGELMQDLPKDIFVHDMKVSRMRYALPGIVKLVRRVRPHTILSTLGNMNLTVLLGKPFMPPRTKVIIRQSGPVSRPAEHAGHSERWLWLYRWLYRKADAVVCQSDYMVDEMRKCFGLRAENLVRIYNPIDIPAIRELANTGDSPYSVRAPNIVAAGGLRWEKGFDLLLDAMPAVLAALPNAQLFLLGDGPRERELRAQCGRLGLDAAVHFEGFQRNPWRYFLHADLFVLSSRHEVLPNALLEALSLGTAVVATDCPGGIREIQERGAVIVLAPPENPAALAKAIIAACSSGCRSEKGFQESREQIRCFDLQTVIREYSQLL